MSLKCWGRKSHQDPQQIPPEMKNGLSDQWGRFWGGVERQGVRTRHRRREGVDNTEGCLHPQPNTESGERRELPQQGAGHSCDRKRIWLLYCCEYYTGDNYMLMIWGACFTLESSTRRSDTANRSRVSIRVAKFFVQSSWRGGLCNNFLYNRL